MRQRSSYLWPSLGPAFGLAGWSFSLLAARSVFGDLPAPRGVPDREVVAAIDFSFRAYASLSLLSFVAAVIIGIYTWRTSRRWAVAAISVVSLFVLTLAGVAFFGG